MSTLDDTITRSIRVLMEASQKGFWHEPMFGGPLHSALGLLTGLALSDDSEDLRVEDQQLTRFLLGWKLDVYYLHSVFVCVFQVYATLVHSQTVSSHVDAHRVIP